MKMIDIQKLVRPNILQLLPYSNARDDFKGSEGIFLDANENPFGELNRYPDPHQTALKAKLSDLKNIPTENIFIGNGSDEVIDLLFRIFCSPEKDKAIICPPTYGMYEVSANINAVELIKIPLDNTFQLNLSAIESYGTVENTETKLIFLCSPNNPTGNSLKDTEAVLKTFQGIVVVDEAYIDFSSSESLLSRLQEFPNLVVMQTLSKAWGLAAARVGIAYASREIIALMNKVKPPYNVSKLNQEAALKVLSDPAAIQNQREILLAQRDYLRTELSKINLVKKIYPSDANFLLAEVSDANMIYQELVKQKLITRNRTSAVKNCLRITVGTAVENQQLIAELKNLNL